MRSFFPLYWGYLIRNRRAMFLTFFFPLMMVVILGPLMPANYILPGLMLLPAIASAFLFTPQGIFQWRNSSLIKRIGITPLKKRNFFISIYITHFIVGIIGLLVVIAFIAFLNGATEYFRVPELDAYGIPTGNFIAKKGAFVWSDCNWWMGVFYFILLLSFTVTTGILLGMFLRKETSTFNAGLFLYFMVTFLGGVFFDITMLYDVGPLKYISFALPWSWCTKAFVASMGPHFMFWNNHNLTKPTDITKVLASGTLLNVTNILGIILPISGTVIGLSLVITKASFAKVR